MSATSLEATRQRGFVMRSGTPLVVATRFLAPLVVTTLAVALFAGAAFAKAPLKRPRLRARRVLVEQTRAVMGATCSVALMSNDEKWSEGSAALVLDELERMDTMLDPGNPAGELAHVNAAGTRPRTPCSPALFACLQASLAVARETDGAFDPTIGPVIRAWAGHAPRDPPSTLAQANAHDAVDWHAVVLDEDGRSVTLRRAGIGLDLVGIERGFALDRAIDILRARGVKRARLELGGQLASFTDSDPWVVKITDPVDTSRTVFEIPVRQAFVSTANASDPDYVRSGRGFDPVRGAPIDERASVTVFAPNGARADGIATALLVMGVDRAGLYAAEHPEIGVLWLVPGDGEIQAWKWNLDRLTPAADASIRWMN